MRRLNVILAVIVLLDTNPAIAGQEKVAFPAYQTHVLYDVLDQPDIKEIREAFVNPEALKNIKPGQPLPSGTVLSLPTFKALVNEKGELVKDPNELEVVFAVMTKDRPDAFLALMDPVLNSYRKRILDFLAKNRLPAIFENKEWVEAGGLISYGPSYPELFRRAAVQMDKILKGTKPADIPVEQPTKFELVINLNTAKQIGVTIPPNVLVRADKVIK